MDYKKHTPQRQKVLDLCSRPDIQTRIDGEPADLCQVQAVLAVCEHGCYMADFYPDPATGEPVVNFDYVPYEKD